MRARPHGRARPCDASGLDCAALSYGNLRPGIAPFRAVWVSSDTTPVVRPGAIALALLDKAGTGHRSCGKFPYSKGTAPDGQPGAPPLSEAAGTPREASNVALTPPASDVSCRRETTACAQSEPAHLELGVASAPDPSGRTDVRERLRPYGRWGFQGERGHASM